MQQPVVHLEANVAQGMCWGAPLDIATSESVPGRGSRRGPRRVPLGRWRRVFRRD